MAKLAQHYTDPRLVALYDIENSSRIDRDFYLALAGDLNPHTIVDLGCGTGELTLELAIEDRVVIGVDPAVGMLNVARQKPGAERVTWIEGDSASLGTAEADLIVMTGNVAQVFLEDADWNATLRNIHAALRPGGTLAFESRNPDDRAWERWNPQTTYEEFDSPHGPMASWLEVVRVEGHCVHMVGHNVFKATGESVIAEDALCFRSHQTLSDSLSEAGFTIEQVYGDWSRGPFTSGSRMMIFVARRR